MNERLQELAKEHLVRDEHTEFGWQECRKYVFDPDELEKFVEKVRSEERVAMLKKITGCENQPSEFGTVTVEYMERQIAREREACAKLCEARGNLHDGLFGNWAQDIAERIRTRGEK